MAAAAKTSVKKWTRAFSNFINLISFHLICQMLGNFSGVNFKGLYLRSEKGKENCCLVFTSSIKRETRRFHVVVVQQRQRNVQKSVMHVQSCCFVNLNLLFFCRSCCRPRRRCLSSLILQTLWRQRPTEHFYSRHFPRPCFNIRSY